MQNKEESYRITTIANGLITQAWQELYLQSSSLNPKKAFPSAKCKNWRNILFETLYIDKILNEIRTQAAFKHIVFDKFQQFITYMDY